MEVISGQDPVTC